MPEVVLRIIGVVVRPSAGILAIPGFNMLRPEAIGRCGIGSIRNIEIVRRTENLADAKSV